MDIGMDDFDDGKDEEKEMCVVAKIQKELDEAGEYGMGPQ